VGNDVEVSIKNGIQEAAPTDQSVTNKEELQEHGDKRSVKYFCLELY
jgi:hypothetical protein